MPTLIVHEIGKKPRAATFDGEAFVIGREDTSDLVLSNVSVSRMHASIVRKAEDSYWVHPIALNNAVLLDGKEVEVDSELVEGSGIQIGRYSLVFTLQDTIPTDYMQEGSHFIDVVCEGCSWSGQLSRHRFNSLKETPDCPRCGGQQFKRFEGAQDTPTPNPDNAPTNSISSTSTNVLDPGVVLDYHERIESAKSGRIDRIGGHSRLVTTRELSHEKPTTLGKEGKTDLAVEGFTWGAPVTVRWDRDAYLIEKGGWLPKISIDGKTVESARLQSGMIFTVGGSTFRYVGS